MLSGQKIVLAVTGSIAAYKSCELLRLLIKRGAEVSVIMTEAAQRFVTPLSFQALGAKKVYTGDWGDSASPIPHIEATKDASLLLVAPATANILAKAAQGLADDLLSAAILAARCPVAYAPAMNTFMWHNQATQRNVTQLTQDGAIFLGPDSGEQACGDIGSGRMLEPEDIIELLQGAFSPRLLDRCRVLITAGPTYEPIDPVRGITNLSSGKQGFAIAKAAALAGAEVTLIAGKCDLNMKFSSVWPPLPIGELPMQAITKSKKNLQAPRIFSLKKIRTFLPVWQRLKMLPIVWVLLRKQIISLITHGLSFTVKTCL